MKQILVLFLSFSMISTLGVAQTKQQKNDNKPAAKVETVSIKVESAVCGSCANTIEKALKKVDGVKSAKVDIDKKVATVNYSAAKANLSQLETAISNSGYDANDTKRNKAAYDKLDDCCKIDGDK